MALAWLVLAGVGCQRLAPPSPAPAAPAPADTVRTVAFTARAASGEVARLASYLTGHFSSAAHAQTDSAYFDIRLRVVPIWPDRADGPWLYVEQAAASALERPYRQRVYHLSQRPDGTLVSAVYELPGDPLAYAGAWQRPDALGTLTPADLAERTGCAVLLRPDDTGRFVGATNGRDCASTLRGAAYATSEVVVGPDGLTSWDRGFAADGTQVWGATDGPYRFDRVDE